MTGPDSLRQLIRQIWNMPYGAPHIAAAEEAVRHADALGDPDLAFDARMAATPAYQHGGEPAKAFVTFSWCLAEYDRDPGRRDAEDDGLLRWYFKYVVSSLTKFPEVPLNRTTWAGVQLKQGPGRMAYSGRKGMTDVNTFVMELGPVQ